jgi:ribosome-associated protein
LSLKAEDVVLLDLRKLSSMADFFVVCSGASDVHVRAIADAVRDGLTAREEHIKPWHMEGYDSLRWVLLDYVHVIVHIFRRESREYYSLEKFWGDAPVETVEDHGTASGGPGS